VGVVAEMPPQARTVRWLADDSAVPFGPRARYRECFLAFPYVILVLVLADGRPTGLQQLFYRTEPLESPDDELLFSNRPNVAKAYGQKSWLCLQHLKLRGQATLLHTLPAIMNHVYSAAFNRSADVHEGNSYWEAMRDVDDRIASLEAWEAATRENRYFAVDVPWRSADTTAVAELRAMLEHADASLPAEPTANDLTGLFTRARSRRQRR
jgi:hypothetical protein